MNFSKYHRKLLYFCQFSSDPVSIYLVKKGILHKLYKKKNLSIPQIVTIENTNFCNANCITCGYHKMTRPKGFMSFELFKKTIDDCYKTDVKTVGLNYFGEAFLDKQLFERIEFAKSKPIETICFQTNGSLLNKYNTDRLLELEIDRLTISIDGATKSVYESIRKNLDFNIVVENTKYFLARKKELNLIKPKVTLNFVKIPQNTHEENLFKEMWRGLLNDNDRIHIAKPFNWGGKYRVPFVTSHELRAPCARIWYQLLILHDGRVALCCNDFDGGAVIGDVRKQSIDEIWNEGPLRKIREKHLNHRIKDIPLCKNCEHHFHWF